MSRKFFGLFGDSKPKQKTLPDIDENCDDATFERRVSVSNSGRWKQKNKHRSVINEDLFASPKKEKSSDNVIYSKKQLEEVREPHKSNQVHVSDNVQSNTSDNCAKIVVDPQTFETAF